MLAVVDNVWVDEIWREKAKELGWRCDGVRSDARKTIYYGRALVGRQVWIWRRSSGKPGVFKDAEHGYDGVRPCTGLGGRETAYRSSEKVLHAHLSTGTRRGLPGSWMERYGSESCAR